jgi:hypothetical protein
VSKICIIKHWMELGRGLQENNLLQIIIMFFLIAKITGFSVTMKSLSVVSKMIFDKPRKHQWPGSYTKSF